MNCNLFLVGINTTFWIEVAKKLSQYEGINLNHATCYFKWYDEKKLRENEPLLKNINFINPIYLNNLNNLIDFVDYNDPSTILDNKILSELKYIEDQFLIICDRLTFLPTSFRRRRRIYRNLLRYWLSFFNKNKIDCILFTWTPHVGWDLVLFGVAKYLGIKIVITGHTHINDRIHFRENYWDIESMPENFLEELSTEEIKAKIDKALLEEAYEGCSLINFSRQINDLATGQKGLNVKKEVEFNDIHPVPVFARKKSVKKFIPLFMQKALREFYENVYLKIKYAKKLIVGRAEHFLTFSAFGKVSPLIPFIGRFIHAKKMKALLAYYNSLCEPMDYNKPFVYFSMHLQPERTSQPEGLIFEDQFLAIQMLHEALPEGWNLYIKENPRQFDITNNRGIMAGIHYRDKKDYIEMKKLKKLKFMPMSEAVDKVREYAICTASLIGSIGWESLLTNKCTIAFGSPWYSPCPSCFNARTVEDCKKAIQEARTRSREQNERDFYRFMVYIQDQLIIGNMDGPSIRFSKRSVEELSKNFCDGAVKKILN